MNEITVIEKFYRIFGEVVLVPIPLGTKKPILKGWQKLTFAASQSPAHREKLLATVARGGNIGILLGKASGGLMAIDLDGDDFADSFLKLNPELANTTRTRGKKGCQLWVRIKPGTNYPKGSGLLFTVNSQGREIRRMALRRRRQRCPVSYLRQAPRRPALSDTTRSAAA
jgi:Bifunctional DNA primase/polymerase, N-terminal